MDVPGINLEEVFCLLVSHEMRYDHQVTYSTMKKTYKTFIDSPESPYATWVSLLVY